jgi:hypothetical protein
MTDSGNKQSKLRNKLYMHNLPDDLTVPSLTHEFRQKLVEARLKKELTQKQLAIVIIRKLLEN